MITNDEKVLGALSDLTNGALNYYQAPQTVMVRENLIREYIEDLQRRIDKAIECIKDFEIQAKHINDEIYLDETLSNKLLDILGGKE